MSIKWGKEKFENVELNTDDPPEVFKAQLFALSGVTPERQKVMLKGSVLKVRLEIIYCKAFKVVGFVIHVMTQHSCPFLTDFFKFKHVTPTSFLVSVCGTWSIYILHPQDQFFPFARIVSPLHDLVGFRSDI